MRTIFKGAILALGLMAPASAQPVTWETYSIAKTSTWVEIPSSIFTDRVGRPPEGDGQRFQSADGRAELVVQAAAIGPSVSPAEFLARQDPPQDIQYKRITPRFFAVSGYKGDKVWYDRCNFSNGLVHCVMMSYPAREERAWDSIVTRISLSLTR